MSNDLVYKIMEQACGRALHSWEYGAAAESLLELYSPELSVFGQDPFPNGKLPTVDWPEVKSLAYSKQFIKTDADILIDGYGKLQSRQLHHVKITDMYE
jgi:hypothetical protein